MKLNKILMALSAMAIVGCSSEDFNDPSVAQAIDDSRLIQLDENFVLAGVGAEDGITRTHWEQDAKTKNLVNVFLPIYTADVSSGLKLSEVSLKKQAVGLCWLGNGGVGTDVYTNYEFYHFGWLNKEEKKANIECDKLTNGAFYSDIRVNADVAANEANPVEADPAKFAFVAGGDAPKDVLNFNSGVYKTDNKAIFGGQYIVYYPYNENFKDAGTIPAVAETSFNWINDIKSTTLGQETFRYSDPVRIEGGDQAADFGLKNLSTLVRLRVSTVAGDPSADNYQIDQIVLYSESGKLLKQANLAADKIAAGKEGAELYAETEGTKTITTKLTSGTAPKLKVGKDTEVKPYITVLPTTVDDLVVLVHSSNATDGKWAKVEMPATEFKAGNAQVLDITVKKADFKSDFIAVDQASLQTALNEARAVPATKAAPQTITVIGDITLTADLNITYTTSDTQNDEYITIKGDDIIVPEDVNLSLKTNMESNVRVLGKSCCDGAQGGRLYVYGGKLGNVTMEPTEAKVTAATYDTYNPQVSFWTNAAEIVAGKTFDVQAGKVEVNSAVAHKGDIKIAKGAKVTVKGDNGELNFMGSNVTNDGTIEVEKNGNFDMTDANGNATATDGQRMINNGTFIHNVDAGVGTAVQSMKQNGEYRCKVDDQIKLDDAFLQWTACSVIEMVHAAPTEGYNLVTAKAISYMHNGKYIDIEVNTDNVTIFNNKPLDNEEIKIGNLTVKNGGLNINYYNETGSGANKKTGNRTLTVKGDMTVAAATNMNSSKKINVTGNLTVSKGIALTYAGNKANADGLEVTKDINVSGTFDASAVNALNIKCANFTLSNPGKAYFGNRTDGAAKNMVVSGTINNPEGCEFDIYAATGGNVLAWVSCKELKVGGSFPHSRPRVE